MEPLTFFLLFLKLFVAFFVEILINTENKILIITLSVFRVYLHLTQDRVLLVVTGTVDVSPWKVAALNVRYPPLVGGR